jgi:hypothetical protein
MYLLNEFITFLNIYHTNISNQYFCEAFWKPYCNRDKSSKYFTTCEEYSKKRYPNLCHGITNLITADVIPKAYELSFDVESFWIDDVYVGFITDKLQSNLFNYWDRIVSFNHLEKKIDQNFLFIRDIETTEDTHSAWLSILNKKKTIQQKVVYEEWQVMMKDILRTNLVEHPDQSLLN